MSATQAIICSLAVLNAAIWGFVLGMNASKRRHVSEMQKAKDLAFAQGELSAWTESTKRLKEALQ